LTWFRNRPPGRSRRRVALTLAVLSLGAAACGLGPVDSVPTTRPAVTGVAATPAPTRTANGYPGVAAFTDPLDRLAYRSGFDHCSLFGAEQLADDLGVRSSDPRSVAAAWADFADPSRPVPASRGCLDGLAAAGAPA